MATFKKKSMRLNEMLEHKLVKEGDLLRYKSKQEELLAIGFAQEGGIRVPKVSGLLGFTGFEGLTRSNYHRPCQFTYAPNSISLQGLVNDGADAEPGAKPAAMELWGLTKGHPTTATTSSAALLEDEHDEFCRICWTGGDLICCETCPAVFHPACLGLSAIPEEDEWYCPLCRCASCGLAGVNGLKDDATNGDHVCWVDPPSSDSVAAKPSAWTGSDFGDVEAAVSIPAATFDRLWPRLAPRIPAAEAAPVPAPKVELPVPKAAPANPLPPLQATQAVKPAEPARPPSPKAAQAPLSQAVPAVRQAADNGPLRMAQGADGEPPAGLSDVLDIEKYVQLATAEEGKRTHQLIEALEADFPSAQGSATKAQRLRNVWAVMFPNHNMKVYAPVRSAALRHIADAMRDIARQRREQGGAAAVQLPSAAATAPRVAPAANAALSSYGAAGTADAALEPADLEKQCMLDARGAASEEALVKAMEDRFPPAGGSAKKAKPIRDLWAILFPNAEFMKSRSAAIPALAHELWRRTHPAAPAALPAPPATSIMGALLMAHGGTPPSPSAGSPGAAKATGLAALVPLGPNQTARAGPGAAGEAVNAGAKSSGSAVASKVVGSAAKGRAKEGAKTGDRTEEPASKEAEADQGAPVAEKSSKEEQKGPKKTQKGAKEVKKSIKQEGGDAASEGASKPVAGKPAVLPTARFSRHRSDAAVEAAVSTGFFPADPESRKRRKLAPSDAPPPAQSSQEAKKAAQKGSNGTAPKAEAAAGKESKSAEMLPAKLRHKAARLGKQGAPVEEKPVANSPGGKPATGKAAAGRKEDMKGLQPASKVPRLRKQVAPHKVELGAADKGSPISKAEQEQLDRALALSLSAAPTARSTRAALMATDDAAKPSPPAGPVNKRQKSAQGPIASPKPSKGGLPAAGKAGKQAKAGSKRKIPQTDGAGDDPEGELSAEDWATGLLAAHGDEHDEEMPEHSAANAEAPIRLDLDAGEGAEPGLPSAAVSEPSPFQPDVAAGMNAGPSQPANGDTSAARPADDGKAEVLKEPAQNAVVASDLAEVQGGQGRPDVQLGAGKPEAAPEARDTGADVPEVAAASAGGSVAEPSLRVRPAAAGSLPSKPATTAAAGLSPEDAAEEGEPEGSAMPQDVAPPELAEAKQVDAATEGTQAASAMEADLAEVPEEPEGTAAGSEPALADNGGSDTFGVEATGDPEAAGEKKQEENPPGPENVEAEVEVPPIDTAVEPLAVGEADLRPAAREGPPLGPEAAAIMCVACGRRAHRGCVQHSQQGGAGPWFCSLGCKEANRRFAQLAAQGLMRASPKLHGVPLAWQLISGAAVSSPQECRGHAPRLDDSARESMRLSLVAARHLLAETCGPLTDSRTGADLLPQMLKGSVLPGSLMRHGGSDLSGFHTALLWAGASIVSVGLVRALGASVAEIVVLTTRPEVQNLGLTRLLLRQLEAALIRCGVKLAIMPSIPLPPPPATAVQPAQAALEDAAAPTSVHAEEDPATTDSGSTSRPAQPPTAPEGSKSGAADNGQLPGDEARVAEPSSAEGRAVPAEAAARQSLEASTEGDAGEAPQDAGAGQAYPLPAGSYGWGLGVGYSLATREQMQELAALPVLVLPGTPVLVKQLSPNTLTTVEQQAGSSCVTGLEFAKEANPASFMKARLLVAS